MQAKYGDIFVTSKLNSLIIDGYLHIPKSFFKDEKKILELKLYGIKRKFSNDFNMDIYIYIEEDRENKIKLICEKKHFESIQNYIKSFQNIKLIDEIIIYSNEDDLIEQFESLEINWKCNILFVGSIPELYLKKLKDYSKNIHFLNIEQLSKEEIRKTTYSHLCNKYPIYDYSPANIRILNNEAIELPYLFSFEENEKLREKINNTFKSYDVLLNFLDENIKKELEKRKLKVIIGNCDKKISSTKVFLNLHPDKESKIFDSLRLDRIIFAGCMVVSETCLYEERLDLIDLIIFSKYDQIVDTVERLVLNYNRIYSNFISELNNVINKITEKRLQQSIKVFNQIRSIKQ